MRFSSSVLVLLCFSRVAAANHRRFIPHDGKLRNSGDPRPIINNNNALFSIRGGAKKKKKKDKKKQKKVKDVSDAMKANSAEALGDAIRDRARDWIHSSPMIESIDDSVSSVGSAMGATTATMVLDAAGGVEAAPASVVAHYFLKSHGGMHALQCVCSGLAALFGLLACLLPYTSEMQIVLLKRCCLFAMIKHLAGLFSAITTTAQAIPQVGLSKARLWMEKLALDPVSQYVYYTSSVLVWLSTWNKDSWFFNLPIIGGHIPWVVVGPILMREVVSTIFVVSDVLLLLQTSTSSKSSRNAVLTMSKSIIDAGMSMLVTPTVWRNSTSKERQLILAKLVGKTSLVLELVTGVMLICDGLSSIGDFTVGQRRPSLWDVGKRLALARLYINFIWVRRTKISKLGSDLRDEASGWPAKVFDTMVNPKSAMGLKGSSAETKVAEGK